MFGHISGLKPDGQLGTSAGIGEVLAIRGRDIDITGPVPSIRLAGTIVSRNGEQTFRQDHPKTSKSKRVVALPTFASDAVRRRLAKVGSMGLDALLLQSRRQPTILDSVTPWRDRRVMWAWCWS